MPNTMPTLCIDAVRPVWTRVDVTPANFLSRNNLSQSASIAMPMAKLLILFVILVRDQEVGGSNPLAPTIIFFPAV
jgi:hypothetical protein